MQVTNAKVLQVNASDALKDEVIARGLHLAFGDEDVFIGCEDVRERVSEISSPELGQLISEALAQGCDYIHLF